MRNATGIQRKKRSWKIRVPMENLKRLGLELSFFKNGKMLVTESQGCGGEGTTKIK